MVIPDEFRGKAVQIVLQSLNAPGAHPFHIHGHGFQVVASSVGPFDEKAQAYANSIDLHGVIVRDTVVVPQHGWVALR
jgi:FtsP/CotA-like multicopper oxidase with cupredoxin domain